MNAHVDLKTTDHAELVRMVTELQAKLAAAPAARSLSLKVSEKGAVSLYGMGRYPVTLYGSQWERLLDASETIRAFLATNAALLSVKAPK